MTAYEKHLTRQAARPTPAQESIAQRAARIEREWEERMYQEAVREGAQQKEPK
jgi:hypothetical protein